MLQYVSLAFFAGVAAIWLGVHVVVLLQTRAPRAPVRSGFRPVVIQGGKAQAPPMADNEAIPRIA